MTYAVTVEMCVPDDSPEMDALHRTGATALLQRGFDAVKAIEGPDGVEADLLDVVVAVYPHGAIVKVFVDAPTLEMAEEAVGSVSVEVLERSELLSEWVVESSEVKLHPDLARESLEAAEGPEAPPSDLQERRARHSTAAPRTDKPEQGTTDHEAVMRGMAARLGAFAPGAFGALDPEEDGEGPESGVTLDDAELAAGALAWACEVLIDELFEDVQTLARAETNVAECEEPLWHLEDLPPRYALRYDQLFSRRFLVTVIALTTRFTDGSFQRLGCVAEELALKFLLGQARVTLDTFGLLGRGVEDALDFFADGVYEDTDFLWLYDGAMDGVDEDPAFSSLRIAPMDLASWFTPFNDGRYVHPYAADESDEAA
ncbi:hypothetical protein [Streptomyces sp. TRM64462]|uniref:hypothetical protein n=1 Tax=Streptomyces sp. TRM64462 TaxID=2741726 RepID=UPI001586A690|nr:hypothetical protein [Streptomyces sp. TRM64462]